MNLRVSSSNARLEEKLNILIAEVRSCKREGSVISLETMDSITRNDQEAWGAFRKELEDVGISASIIAEKRMFLIAWFQEAVATGKLEEDVLEKEGRDENGNRSDQSVCMQSSMGRKTYHEPHDSDSTPRPLSGQGPIVHLELLDQQRSSIGSIASDGTRLELADLAITGSIEECQIEPRASQPQPSTKNLVQKLDHTDVTSGEVFKDPILPSGKCKACLVYYL